MKNKSAKKKKFLSKFLAKIVRKFGFEIIDQSTLEISSNEKFANENLSKSGTKSVTVPLGSTKITNKINSLTIIIRSYTFGDTDKNQVMLDQNKFIDKAKLLQTRVDIVLTYESSKSASVKLYLCKSGVCANN